MKLQMNLVCKIFVSVFSFYNSSVSVKSISGSDDSLPEFTDEVENRTVVSGREATLSCHVEGLGSYKVSLALLVALVLH